MCWDTGAQKREIGLWINDESAQFRRGAIAALNQLNVNAVRV